MQAKNRVDFRVLHATLFNHQSGTTVFADGRHFFCGLKDEFDSAVNLIAHLREHFSHTHEDRDVRVVSASVHHACLCAIPLGTHHTLEGHIGFFSHRQAIHIRTKGNAWAGFGAFQYAYHAGIRHFFFDLVKAEFSQMIGDKFTGTKFPITQFRVGVQVATPGDYLIIQAVGVLGNDGIGCQKGVGGIHVFLLLETAAIIASCWLNRPVPLPGVVIMKAEKCQMDRQ